MEALRLYLNSLSTARQADFAAKCHTTIGYLRKAISKNQELGAAICVAIEKYSEGDISRKQLRTDWVGIWPELKSGNIKQTVTELI